MVELETAWPTADVNSLAKVMETYEVDNDKYPTTFALLNAPGGAKLPEEISRDPSWLAAWIRAMEPPSLWPNNMGISTPS